MNRLFIFFCNGVNDSVTTPAYVLLPDETPSETLPEGWANSDSPYRYVSNVEHRRKYLLTFAEHGNFLLVNLVSLEDQTALAMNINLDQEVDNAQLSSNKYVLL